MFADDKPRNFTGACSQKITVILEGAPLGSVELYSRSGRRAESAPEGLIRRKRYSGISHADIIAEVG